MKITPESLATGVDQELSRVVQSDRGLLFVRDRQGLFRVVHAELDEDGNIVHVLGAFRMFANRIGDLVHALHRAEARMKRTN